ncbi:MAG: hypothetical protein EXR77_09700 [Myxococcales bacterium]|nr:hypothetical protein [Myxococcales bacterium]
MNTPRFSAFAASILALVLCSACADSETGLFPTNSARVKVKVDLLHRPLPELPLPSDLATRLTPASPTGRRINASLVASTHFERLVRGKIDELDGWGVYMPISIPFDGPIDPLVVRKAHVGDDYATANDVVYVIDVTPNSPDFRKPMPMDLGAGNFPIVLGERDLNGHSSSDARGDSLSVLFDEVDEDTNKNGLLDPGEDTDLDGLLDQPNYLPGQTPTATDLAGRADALMTFYERQTHTLLLRPLVPLRERTTYAVVVTRRLLDAKGQPVGSPFPGAHHLDQRQALQPLAELLDTQPAALGGLSRADVAFAWTFSTGSMMNDYKVVRDGLYGFGAQKHLATAFAPTLQLRKMDLEQDNKPHAGMYVLSGATFSAMLQLLNGTFFNFKDGSEEASRLMKAQKYVDFHVFGLMPSPRLFPRKGPNGYLDYNEMTWPVDLATTPTAAEVELVPFWLTVPKKSVSARKDGKPASVAIIGHGYMSSRIDAALFGGYMAQHGLAAFSIDNVSHGLPLGPKELAEFATDYGDVAGSLGARGVVAALADTRAWDQDLDGNPDSGADFWTAYTFHTRDVLRQTAVDYMQLARVLRSFDGKRSWDNDCNGDGKGGDLAGDFDGDGIVDIGGADATIGMTGSSLGGITAAMMTGLEPHIAATVPMCAGGGLGDVGVRSEQGGVREAVILRIMGPLYVGTPKDGKLAIQTVVPRMNKTETITVSHAKLVKAGDGVLVQNLDNGEYDCALVTADGRFQVAVASDVVMAKPQAHKISIFQGNPFLVGVRDPVKGKACSVKAGAKPVQVVDSFDTDVKFHFQSKPLLFKSGDALAPLAEGLALHRARPELRRFMGIAQTVLDPADPAVIAASWKYGSLKYATGEKPNAHMVVLTTIGDLAVPVATGAAIARSGGLLDYTTKRAEWDQRTANQVLIDAHVLEGVHRYGRYKTPTGEPVLVDPEDLSGSAALTAGTAWLTAPPYPSGKDGYFLPRLRTGLHKFLIGKDNHDGVSGALFPMVIPEGRHDLNDPGVHTDKQVAQCKKLGGDSDKCAAKNNAYFDNGSLLRHTIAAYLANGGKAFEMHSCYSTDNCPAALVPGPP